MTGRRKITETTRLKTRLPSSCPERYAPLLLATRTPVTVWGTGSPRREFLYVDDCADACLFLLKTYSGAGHVNVGSGSDVSILELTRLVMEVLDYDGEIVTDPSKPDGTPRKLMDNTRLRSLGWAPRVGLAEGIKRSYAAFLAGEGRNL